MTGKDGLRSMHFGNRASLAMKVLGFPLGFPAACALLALMFGVAPASAVEQCRFIQAKPEREACYQRQEAELAAKKKPEPKRDKTMEALEEMKHEDEALNRQIHSICRGC